MKKIKFNIDYRDAIESGTMKVVTRFGRPARVICWDLKCKRYPIAAAFMNDDDDSVVEDVSTYTPLGEVEEGQESLNDMFLLDGAITKEEQENIKKILRLRPASESKILVCEGGLRIEGVTLTWNALLQICDIIKL